MTGAAGWGPVVAPDFVEPVEAWRVWSVVRGRDGYRLASVFAPVTWPVGAPLDAECLRRPSLFGRLRRITAHPAPESRCECGIYGTELRSLAEYLLALSGRAGVGRVVGQVALWGDVVECERGVRAAQAYPRALFVPMNGTVDAWQIARGLTDYGVPVECLENRHGDLPRELERRLAA